MAMEWLIIRNPRAYESEKEPKLEETIKESLSNTLSSRYNLEFTDKDYSFYSKETITPLLLICLYKRKKFSTQYLRTNLQPQTGEIIDAISVSTKYELLKEIEAELDKEEFNIPDKDSARIFP